MNANFRKIVTVSLATGLLAMTAQWAAAQSYLNAAAKASGNYGQAGAQNSWSSGGNYYRAPVIARTQPAPNTVATVPSDRRSMSFDPALGAVTPPATTVKKDAGKTDTSIAKKSAPTTRTFSYEPQTNYSSVPARSRSVPLYELPKSDPRKFGGR